MKDEEVTSGNVRKHRHKKTASCALQREEQVFIGRYRRQLEASTVSPFRCRQRGNQRAAPLVIRGVPLANLPVLSASSLIEIYLPTAVAVKGQVPGVYWALASFTCASLISCGVRAASFLWHTYLFEIVFGSPEDEAGERTILEGIDVTDYELLCSEEAKEAAAFAAAYHGDQMRLTGQPYVTHCIEAACIVASLVPPTGVRSQTAVLAAILHDVVDDTDCELTDVTAKFGPEVSSLVDGVTQLSQINQLLRRHRRQQEAEGDSLKLEENEVLRRLVLSIVDDPRVMLVKLADRLHNMRTLYVLPPRKQVALAQETLNVWCGLAARLGVFSLKAELEDQCFAVLQPETFHQVQSNLHSLWLQEEKGSKRPRFQAETSASPSTSGAGQASNMTESTMSSPTGVTYSRLSSIVPFDRTSNWAADKAYSPPEKAAAVEALSRLDSFKIVLRYQMQLQGVVSGIEVSMTGRLKSLYSTYSKMSRKGITFDQVYDSRALRVVLDDSNGVTGAQAVEGCYRMVQLVHSLWKPIPGEYDDYIVNRKPSGYQSLHTAVVGPDGGPLEVQIRTKTMHEVAEYGTAAHWVYKETPATAVEAVDFTQVAPKAAEPSDDPRPGQPAVRMSNGRFQDAVVVRTEEGGRRLLVSSATRFIQNTTRPGPKEEYDEMLDYLEAKGWHEKGQGDGRYTLEDFVRCRDGRFHKEDCYGHKLPTTVELLQDYAPSPSSRSGDNPDTDTPETSVSEREVVTALLPSPKSGSPLYRASRPPRTSLSPDELNDKVRLLRSMLEWEAEVMTGEEVGPGEVESLMDGDWHSVTVITWPDGEIHRLPRGASAGDVFLSSTEEVNVNNQIVPRDTKLKDGDLIIRQ
ncbi:hypothetical protein CYMTET_15372 [Cymbomonas tetramitiformis]|uniref:GTP diphosphokinase n=1 Tax=Cymbomonas tetramitiformis TaxID=36881 RepID=A0AAE0L9E7_9CHLO|nr:hypothetical protein CYMTET_15372 [Cymbomonas tetramitiformis]